MVVQTVVIIQCFHELFVVGAGEVLLIMLMICGNGAHSWDRQFCRQSILAHREVRSGSPAVAIATADNLELGKISVENPPTDLKAFVEHNSTAGELL